MNRDSGLKALLQVKANKPELVLDFGFEGMDVWWFLSWFA